MDKDKLWYLSRINIFHDLDEMSLRAIEAIAPMTSVRAGVVVMQPGEQTSVLYLLKHGRMRLYKIHPDGRELTLSMLRGGNVFGSTGEIRLGSDDMYAETLDEVLLCAMRKPDVERLLQLHPEVGVRLLEVLSQRVRSLETLLESLAYEGVQQRILRLLLRLGEEFGVREGPFTRIDVTITHDELASMVGSARETVSATLSRLATSGLVRTGRRTVAIQSERARQVLALPTGAIGSGKPRSGARSAWVRAAKRERPRPL